MIDLLDIALAELKSGKDLTLITVVETEGSMPARVGARMLVFERSIRGTVGGGALEKVAIDMARAMMERGEESRLVRFESEDLGMACGGAISLFMERLVPAPRLWVFGGGHIAKALTPIASSLGFRVVVADNRGEFASQERFPEASRVVCGEYAETARNVEPGSYAVIATHGHAHDLEVLTEVLRIEPPLPYIGMIGSRRKVGEIVEALNARGLSCGPNIYTPVGLDLGGGSPAEIAVSIASELVGIVHGRSNLPHCRVRLDT